MLKENATYIDATHINIKRSNHAKNLHGFASTQIECMHESKFGQWSVYLSIYLSIYQSIGLSIYHSSVYLSSFYPPIYQLINLSIHLILLGLERWSLIEFTAYTKDA